MISSLSIFLQSDRIISSKQSSLESFRLSSALIGSIARLLASLSELKFDVNLIRNADQVVGIIERLLFSCKPDLLISCGISPIENG
jgi:hypothetical protein